MYFIRETKLAITICAGLAAGFLMPGSANAQCSAGLGGTPSQLATQAWPPAQGFDFTSFTDIVGMLGPQQSDNFVGASSIAADGQGSIYVIDPRIGPMGSLLQLHTNGASLSLAGVLGQARPQTQVFYAGGFVWTVNSYGDAQPYTPGRNQLPNFFINLGAAATGATYDGTYVWFMTANGTLFAVAPPVYTAQGQYQGQWSAPRIAKKIATGMQLSGASFDGSNIWTTSAKAQLIQVDPVGGSVSIYPMPSQIASIFFDGASLWVGSQNSGSIYQFDPLQGQIKSTIPAPVPGRVFSSGNLFRISYQAGRQVATMRTCDGETVGISNLPGPPIQSAFDGSQVWTVYGNGTVSVR